MPRMLQVKLGTFGWQIVRVANMEIAKQKGAILISIRPGVDGDRNSQSKACNDENRAGRAALV